MSASLKKAQDSLILRDVYFSSTVGKTINDFDPKYVANLHDLYIQTAEYIDRFDIILAEEDQKKIYRAFVNFGSRWLSDDTPKKKSLKTEDNRSIHAIIEARLIVEYFLSADAEEEKLSTLASKVAFSDAWPLWKEYLISELNRLKLSGVKIPEQKKRS
ncbi:hypothetical protein I5S62_06250 [Pseudomonas putida]|uniref:hypothetical protein n=1 Tax=Pseudomonas putida TaxID=303 RepID=UPI0018D9D439|nr:hypothetical protein [Pseudomonas putida]ELU0814225.1 hypothetical protein [Pseudomonas putida]MBH3388719.1 hypothetical protein [Pseudomonas putida]